MKTLIVMLMVALALVGTATAEMGWVLLWNSTGYEDDNLDIYTNASAAPWATLNSTCHDGTYCLRGTTAGGSIQLYIDNATFYSNITLSNYSMRTWVRAIVQGSGNHIYAGGMWAFIDTTHYYAAGLSPMTDDSSRASIHYIDGAGFQFENLVNVADDYYGTWVYGEYIHYTNGTTQADMYTDAGKGTHIVGSGWSQTAGFTTGHFGLQTYRTGDFDNTEYYIWAELPVDVNTPPDNVNDSDWITPSANPFTHDGTSFLFNWTNSTDNETAVLTYRFIVNDTVIATTNDSDYTHTFPSQGKFHYLVNVSESDNLTRWVEGTTRNFSVDTTSPTVTIHSPLPDNTTIITDATLVITNATFTDNLEVFAYNISIWTAEYQATTFSLDTGTLITGSISSFRADDNDTFQYSEVTGSPGWQLHVNYTGVTALRSLHFIGLYGGSPAHEANLEIWNATSSAWELLVEIPANNSVTNTVIVLDDAHHIDSGLVRVRFNHPGAGNVNHMVAINKLSLNAVHGIIPITHVAALNLNVTSTTVNHTFSLAGQDDGEYVTQWYVVDSHTAFDAGIIGVDKNDTTRTVTFHREDDISIRHVRSLEVNEQNDILADLTWTFSTWETTQLGSKVSFTQKAQDRKGLFRHEYLVSSSEALFIQPDSTYAGHIVSGWYSWVDYEHEGMVSVTMKYTGPNVFVTVISTEASPQYESIGGLNNVTAFAHFTLATTGPSVINLRDMDGTSYDPDRTYFLNATVTDPHGISSVTAELNGTNITMINIAGDVFQANTTPLGAGTYTWEVHANDTLGLVTVSATGTFNISKATPIINLSSNVTFPVINSTAVLINCTVDNTEQNATLYINGVINGSSASYDSFTAAPTYVCNVTETGNYTSATDSLIPTITFPGVIPGFLQPGDCPDDTTQDVLMFGLLFMIIITLFIMNQLFIKIPFIDAAGGIAMIFYSFALIGCNTALGGFGIIFGVTMMIYGYLKD